METCGIQGEGNKLTLGAINLVLSTLLTPEIQRKKAMKVQSSFNHSYTADLYLFKGLCEMLE